MGSNFCYELHVNYFLMLAVHSDGALRGQLFPVFAAFHFVYHS